MEGEVGGEAGQPQSLLKRDSSPPLLLSHSRCLEDYTHTRNLASPLQSSVQRRRKRQRVYCHPLTHTYTHTDLHTHTDADRPCGV